MKKISIIVLLGIAIVLFLSFSAKKEEVSVISGKSVHATHIPLPTVQATKITNSILFVPYWTVKDGIDKNYNEYIYFGVTPSTDGIDHSELGFQNIQSFIASAPSGAKKMLGVRMIDNSLNETILQNMPLQQKIISDAVTIARNNGFDGVVLDLEYSAFPFDSVIQSVSAFSKKFASRVKAEHLLFYQTLYGDTYYRGRPYTVKDLAKNADRILIMAYDFHKASGDPGANFPLVDSDDGYSFEEMVSNFTKEVSSSKLAVVFGMFGYDWTLNEKGNSVGVAESLSDNEIVQKFISHCTFKGCSIKQNTSLETKISYEDSMGQQHEVWFEDKASVGKKESVLEQNGISSVGFWANGYF